MNLARWWMARRASCRAGRLSPPGLPATTTQAGPALPARPSPPAVENPFTLAIQFGRCPLCMGSGEMGQLAVCLHDPPLCAPGSPCHLCLGSGRWPPPLPLDEGG